MKAARSTCDALASRARRSLRATGLGLLVVASASCGKKGPPLAPFVRVPAAVAAVTPQRIADDVYLSFAVPDSNADGQKPAAISELQVYAVTSERAPETEEQRELATLVATIPVRPILPPLPPLPEGVPEPPPIPLPPGVDQGATVIARETLTADSRVAIELPTDAKPEPKDPEEVVELFGPMIAPAATQLPRRHYFVVGVSARGRESTPSTPVSVPLEAVSSAPGAPVIAHTATELTLTWSPSPDARTATIAPPPVIKPPPVPPVTPGNETPANVTPKAPVAPPLLVAKSLGFNTQATTYHVYDVTSASAREESGELPRDLAGAASGREGGPADPYAVKQPTPITPLPLSETEFVIRPVGFGVERCFQVRPVDQVFGVTVIGPPSPTTCVTPQDTFPPVAPRSLAAIAGSGVISLIWDANAEADLAGYIVLRGEAPGDTLQPITPEPVTVTSYRDESVKAGVRYVYAVVAVDRATNASPQSNRAEETARQ